MNYQEYISKKREIYDVLIQFIEDERDDDSSFQELIDTFNRQKIQENEEELTLFFCLVVQISNHHRFPNFFEKIKQILQYFQKIIEQNYLNSEIFKIFKSNRIIMLFLNQKSDNYNW